jgi:hypothetical protein
MVAGAVMGGGLGGVASFAGSLLLVFGLLIPVTPPAARRRRAELERELAAFSTPAERRDLEATLDQYPDDVTQELRDILAGQAMAAYNNRFPAAGRY